ncbi:hypothetical protein Pst134EA_013823 [Puccinia striiformis f. sp. tritici]|uniref:hypothetical protein n=1 Tax=Puccinia striiformis f. sp. tritici TaxID=168172 RepID=UPI0020084DA2|nr:hypothetical protein Pst134EA_013823 [Puccinia striiformis f. sp. tritici]KAH9465969.1 hypothetical protein Pst134EA_013823 [Puccinia striiformis f. sp. tritici]
MDNYTAVVSIGRMNALTAASPSGSKTGRKFKTFPTNKPRNDLSQPTVDPKKDAFTNTSSDVEMSHPETSHLDLKGKRKATSMEQPPDSDSYDSDTPIVKSARFDVTKPRVRTPPSGSNNSRLPVSIIALRSPSAATPSSFQPFLVNKFSLHPHFLSNRLKHVNITPLSCSYPPSQLL